jgi:hypothetical protein
MYARATTGAGVHIQGQIQGIIPLAIQGQELHPILNITEHVHLTDPGIQDPHQAAEVLTHVLLQAVGEHIHVLQHQGAAVVPTIVLPVVREVVTTAPPAVQGAVTAGHQVVRDPEAAILLLHVQAQGVVIVHLQEALAAAVATADHQAQEAVVATVDPAAAHQEAVDQEAAAAQDHPAAAVVEEDKNITYNNMIPRFCGIFFNL